MYQRIEEKYKKTSEIKKFDTFILIDFLIILIISYIFKEYHLFIFIVLLIGIIIFYLYMGIKIGYSFIDYIKFILTRIECLSLIIGIILIKISLKSIK